jgi:hypothetical protein
MGDSGLKGARKEVECGKQYTETHFGGRNYDGKR